MSKPSALGAVLIVFGSLIAAVPLTAWGGALGAAAVPGGLSVVGLLMIGATMLKDRRERKKRAKREIEGSPEGHR